MSDPSSGQQLRRAVAATALMLLAALILPAQVLHGDRCAVAFTLLVGCAALLAAAGNWLGFWESR